ncbi:MULTISPECIES: hypothetical protein [unclassified Arcicella]|uniref:hypothetical protein n=1 Tax=unclassified Arcicella TaxID=2644986 RepID=UPI002854BFC0|nr:MULTISPECIES: hypothetical protein [unclassified Arcicella]MDR6563248.1 hypothetical protein [Arcicella sp. BE51]MDR6811601.1 hypothetical protein [Arcicella sp. BE140]MDR6823127.1 hypothetical protein [Arcicella sp. BE139]
MNKLLIIFLLLGINTSKPEAIRSLALSYQTRGVQKHLFITADSTIVSINAERYSYKTKASEWKKILKTLEKVKLSRISRLKRPSTKSYYDGAMIAQLNIQTTKKTYESINFDHNNPPSLLVKPINAMKATLVKPELKGSF